MADLHPLFHHLGALAQAGPVITAHRGDSGNHAENTLPAFTAARALGVAMQEFDVHCTRDGALVVIHDHTLDRTTDAARRLGPGALVAQCDLATLRSLDAGSWHPRHPTPLSRIPTLAEALAAIGTAAVPMLEHKAGPATRYAEELARLGADDCLVQSFDWQFLRDLRNLRPRQPLALLGPTARNSSVDAEVVAAAGDLAAGMVHWQADALTPDEVALAHAAGLLVCTYTTDHVLGLLGAASMGVDALCSNEPARLLEWRQRYAGCWPHRIRPGSDQA